LKKNCFFIYFTAALFLLFLSCDILRDSPFEVSGWSPGEGFHDSPEDLSLSLVFSHNPDRASAEQHFSLTGDDGGVGGSFSWEGRRMIFLPYAPLEENKNYRITLTADVRDEAGLSMDKPFEGNFTTRPDNTRPRLISLFPETGSVVTESRAEVRVVFSQAVPLVSLRDHVSFSPVMNGSWISGEEKGSALFIPGESWKQGQRYEIRISSSLAGNTGMTLGKDFTSVFTFGDDLTKPFLKGAWRLDPGGLLNKLDEEIPAAAGIVKGDFENRGWEKDSRLLLVFSEQVDTASVKSCLSAEPAPSLVLETPPGFAEELVFSFSERPAYGSRFFFQVKAGVRDAAGNEGEGGPLFRIYADGPYSKPPALMGIRLPLVSGEIPLEDKELRDYSIESLFEDLPIAPGDDRYPFQEPTPFWIELYFDTAPGTAADVFSMMDLFRIETSNNVLSFSSRSVRETDFSVGSPRPGWESYSRLEIRGYLTNTVNSGVVSFRIDPGLADKLGNRNENSFCISLLK
jgi:hypothetical protein